MNEVINFVQLVDTVGNPIGIMDKIEAHRSSTLHRAVSVLVFNSSGKWLLHRRAITKYHSGGLWTNACCTHPFPGEDYAEAARRRLQEEMGILTKDQFIHLMDFVYQAKVNNELTEYEYDRVFTLISDDLPEPHPDEVDEWKYLSTEELLKEIKHHPEHFTEWFKLFFQQPTIIEMLKTNN
jgi:isopentenyl-diphosphate delta-isomerase